MCIGLRVFLIACHYLEVRVHQRKRLWVGIDKTDQHQVFVHVISIDTDSAEPNVMLSG